MQFRDELPPPRYALDGDVEDSDIVTEKQYDLKLDVPDLSGSDLVLLAPRCACLAADFGGAPLGTIKFSANSRPKQSINALVAAAQDFYEVEASAEDFTSSQHWSVPLRKGPHGLVVALLPALPEAESAYLGRELVLRLNPGKVVLATPGLSFMDQEVCYLTNNKYIQSNSDLPVDLPKAEPPVIVQGVGAASVSRAQQRDIPALALVVRSDGPSNHEVISESGMNALRRSLFQVLRLKLVSGTQVENSMSVLYV